MQTIQIEHYHVYSWMSGEFDLQLENNRQCFEGHNLFLQGSRIAIDLGSGCGFQSIPLAELGFSVTAIDLDEDLLCELKKHDTTESVRVIQDDVLKFSQYVSNQIEIAVCVFTHL